MDFRTLVCSHTHTKWIESEKREFEKRTWQVRSISVIRLTWTKIHKNTRTTNRLTSSDCQSLFVPLSKSVSLSLPLILFSLASQVVSIQEIVLFVCQSVSRRRPRLTLNLIQVSSWHTSIDASSYSETFPWKYSLLSDSDCITFFHPLVLFTQCNIYHFSLVWKVYWIYPVRQTHTNSCVHRTWCVCV